MCWACISEVAPAPQLAPPVGIDHWIAPFAYEGVIRDVVARAKYRNQRHALPWLATQIAAAAEPQCRSDAIEVITWIPTTRAHRNARGFDHAQILAKAVASLLRLPVRAM